MWVRYQLILHHTNESIKIRLYSSSFLLCFPIPMIFDFLFDLKEKIILRMVVVLFVLIRSASSLCLNTHTLVSGHYLIAGFGGFSNKRVKNVQATESHFALNYTCSNALYYTT